jgi:hypothetical protein
MTAIDALARRVACDDERTRISGGRMQRCSWH